MTLNRIACIASMLLLACAAYAAEESGVSSLGKMGYQCGYENETSNPKIYKCTINQYTSDKAANNAVSNGFTIYDTWGDFADGINAVMDVQLEGSGNVEFDLYFGSDIALNGSVTKNGNTICPEQFKPIQLPSNTYRFKIYGQGHTISNFCDQRNGNAGFFRSLEKGLVKKLKFENAYVESYGNTDPKPFAGVVVASASGVEFNDVTITGSKVVSTGGAGGLAGRLSGMEDGVTKIWGCQVDADLKGQKIGALASVLDNTAQGNGEIEIKKNMVNLVVADDRVATDSNIYVGGLIGYADFSEDIHYSDVNLSQNRVTLDLNEIESGASAGLVTSPSYYLGGLIGRVTSKSNFYSFEDVVAVASIKLDRTVQAPVYAGGEIGRVEAEGDPLGSRMLCSFENDTVNVSLDVKTKGATIEGLGGIVGNLRWAPQGDIQFTSNVVNADIDSKNSSTSRLYVGGLAGNVMEYDGSGTDKGMLLESSGGNLTLAMKVASESIVFAGGLFGYVKDVKSTNTSLLSGFQSTADTVKAAEGKKLFEITSSKALKLFVGGVVGEFISRNPIIIASSRVQGDMEMASTTMTAGGENDTAVVGGIAGLISATDMIVYGNVSEGNIHSPVITTVGHLGGVIGALDLPYADPEDFGVNVYSNYHYGKDDAEVPDALGSFKWAATRISDWETNGVKDVDRKYFIQYNYRNALDNLESDGGFSLEGDGAIVTGSNTKQYNGIVDGDVMKSRLFCYVMNQAFSSILAQPIRYKNNWENEPGELPAVSNQRTVYQAKVNLDAIYDALKPEDKSSLKGYLFNDVTGSYAFAYTEKDGFLPDDFVTKMKNLSVNYAPTYLGAAVDLSGRKIMGSDQFFRTAINRRFNVVYQAFDPSDPSNQIPLDDLEPIYFWPKMDTASLFYEKGVIPPALVKENGTWEEYTLVEYLIKCREGAGSCSDIQYSPPYDKNKTFEDIFADITSKSTEVTDEHLGTLYLIYANNPVAPIVNVAVQGEGTAFLYGYDKEGALTAIDSTKDEYGNPKPDVRLTSRMGLQAPIGYKLKNWQADIWMADFSQVSDNDEFEACYADYYGSFSCVGHVEKNGDGLYVAGSDSLYMGYERARKDVVNRAVKWTVPLKGDDMLNMDSVVAAFAPGAGFNSLLLHVHAAPNYEAIPYKGSFYLNTTSKDLFFTDEFYGNRIFGFNNGNPAELPKVLRTDACFVGWSATPLAGAPDGNIYVSEFLDDSLIYYAKPLNDSFAVYAAWAPDGDPSCPSIQTMELSLIETPDKNSKSHGTVYLWQSYAEPGSDTVVYKHYFEDGKMVVPARGLYNATFHVSAVPDKGYVLDSLWLNTVSSIGNPPQIDTVIPSSKAGSDSTFTIMLEGIFTYTLKPKFCKYIEMGYDLNSDRKDVFFGVQSLIDGRVMVKDNSAWIGLPRWIYTDDACVLGWAVKSDADTLDFYDYVSNNALLQKISDGDPLYAVWGDANQCVKDAYYKKATLVAENGTIMFDEFLYEGANDSSDYRTHKFAGDSVMLLPEDWGTSVFLLRAAPQPGFKLDSVVAVYDDNGEELRKTLKDGDSLSDSLSNAVFTAYFSEGSSQQLEFVRSEFRQSGSAVRLVLETDSALAKRAASFQVVLLDALGNIVPNTDVTRKLAAPYSDTLTFYPLLPGVYELQAGLGTGAASFDTVFTVAPEIAVAPNEWRMVSLGSVDMESIVWDDDPVFYWWDESSLGGEFWQYNSLKDSKKVNHEVGYWYNSLEGRPLKFAIDTANSDTEVHWEIDSIYSGWNLVANPYNWSVDIKNTEGFNNNPVCYNEPPKNRHGGQGGQEEWSEIEFWKYDPVSGNYALADTIGPFEGVWVKTGCSKEWGFNAKPVFPEPSLPSRDHEPWAAQKSALAKASAVDSWTLQAKLVDGKGKVDAWNVLGVGSKNVVAEEPPEAMGDHVNLSIVDGKRLLAKSVKAGTVSPEWTVELSASSNRTGYLSFEGVGALREYGLKVFVTVDGKTTEMRDGEPLKVALTKAAKYATVRVAESAPVVLAYQLGGVRAFQVGHGLQVSFDVSNGLAGKTARVDLVDLKGHIVSTATGKALVGANTVAVEAPLSGLYVVRVRLGGKQSVTKVLVR